MYENAADPAFTNALVIRYGFEVTNPLGEPLSNVVLRVWTPAPRTATQHLRSLATAPAADLHAEDGALFAAFRFPVLPPYATADVALVARLDARAAPAPWIGPPPVALAATIPLSLELSAALEPFEGAGLDAVAEGVRRAFRYTGYHERDRGLRWTLDRREGDCSELASLCALLARRAGMPACRALGVVAVEGRILRAADLHEWCLALEDERWRVVDTPRAAPLREGAHIVFRFAQPAVDPGPGPRLFTVEPPEARVKMVP